MLPIRSAGPAIFNGMGQFSLKPGAAIADAPSAAFVFAGRTAKFDRP